MTMMVEGKEDDDKMVWRKEALLTSILNDVTMISIIFAIIFTFKPS
jgi:hypothetical protein